MKNIVVIGVGALGSRHLQSLVNLSKEDFKVYAVDPNQNSLDKAKDRSFLSKSLSLPPS